MKKYIYTILISIVVGFVFGSFMYKQYDSKQKLKTVFNDTNKIYFIQQGVYSNKENMEKTMTKFSYYIYNLEDNKYYVYIGITGSKENSIKLKDYYKELGYDIYVKEMTLNNDGFIEILKQYDEVMKKSTDKKMLETISQQVLAKYEELVITR